MTAKNAPGKHYRTGISLMDAVKQFGDDDKAEAWFIAQRWPDGMECVYCDGPNVVRRNANRKTPLYRCNECRKDFTVKVGTVMEGSNLSLSKWAVAFYLVTMNLKGVSSMKLHRDLGISQKAAWFMVHRIRETWKDETTVKFVGPVEADETAIGGVEKNKHTDKKLHARRGSVGKSIVHGILDRETNQVVAGVVDSPDAVTLQGRVLDATAPHRTGIHRRGNGLRGPCCGGHVTIQHSAGEYVRDMAHTNGIESFWSLLDRGIMGTFHHVSPKHLNRYVSEFSGRHNNRPADTFTQMQRIAGEMVGKRLKYKELIAWQQNTTQL